MVQKYTSKMLPGALSPEIRTLEMQVRPGAAPPASQAGSGLGVAVGEILSLQSPRGMVPEASGEKKGAAVGKVGHRAKEECEPPQPSSLEPPAESGGHGWGDRKSRQERTYCVWHCARPPRNQDAGWVCPEVLCPLHCQLVLNMRCGPESLGMVELPGALETMNSKPSSCQSGSLCVVIQLMRTEPG